MLDSRTTESAEKEESNDAKWAAEAFAFLRLFQRVGNQIWGLILLEVGWALLLMLVGKLSEPDSKPVLRLPWFAEDGHFGLEDIPLTSLFPIGGLALVVVWLFSSGLHIYVALFVQRLLRPLLIAGGGIIGTLLIVLQILFEWPLIVKRRKEQRYSDIKRILEPLHESNEYKATTSADARRQQRWQTYMSAMHQELISTRPSMKKGFALWMTLLLERGLDWVGERISSIASSGRIGLAPFYSYSFSEEEKAVKAPLQIFAGAVGQLRVWMRDLNAVRFMYFRALPPLFKVMTEQRARVIRKLLGLDAVLWGSYLSTAPPCLWLNVEYAMRKTQARRAKVEGREDVNLFYATSLDVNEPLIILDQDDLTDSYIGVSLALLQALQTRREHKPWILPQMRENMDQLRYNISDRRLSKSALSR